MFIGVLKASLYLSEPQSLKDKRRVIKGLCDRIKTNLTWQLPRQAVWTHGTIVSWELCAYQMKPPMPTVCCQVLSISLKPKGPSN